MIEPRFYKAGEICPGDKILARPWLYAFEEDNTVVPGVVKSISVAWPFSSPEPIGTITGISFVSSMTDQVHTARKGNFWRLEDAFDSGIDMDMDIGVDWKDPEDVKRQIQPELFGNPICLHRHLGCQKEKLIEYYDYPVLVSQNYGCNPSFVIVGIVIEHQLEGSPYIRSLYRDKCQLVGQKLSYVVPLPEKHLKVVEQLARCRGFYGTRMELPNRGTSWVVYSLDAETFEKRLAKMKKREFIHMYMKSDERYKFISYMGRTILSFESTSSYGSGYYSVVVGVVGNYKFRIEGNLPITAITIVPDQDQAMVEKELRMSGLRGPVSFWDD